MKFRVEQDSLGKIKVPLEAYYGAQTQRALDNFPIHDIRMPPELLHALATLKRFAAEVNKELGLLEAGFADAIVQAAAEAGRGELDDQFIVSVFQTGSGTSTNMNMNEVLASRANELLTGQRGGKSPVHPNDHVNLGQSSNDVIPSAIHLAALVSIKNRLIPALAQLHSALSQKSSAFAEIRKIGRTHLQDAVPMRLGQEFSGYARQVELGIARIRAVEDRLAELALGGTAVGNGLNTHPEFAGRVIARIAAETKIGFREAVNHFEAQGAQDAAVETSGALKTIAVALVKISNDIRWLASGPRCGIGEINIPPLQPGSSIMPGKVNPIIPEAVIQASAQVIGNDSVITLGGQFGVFELNLMMPVIAHNLLQSIHLLAATSKALAEKCIDGITANIEKCGDYIEKSLALVTALVPRLGYDQAAAVAKQAYESNKTVREIVLEQKVMSAEEFERLLELASSIT